MYKFVHASDFHLGCCMNKKYFSHEKDASMLKSFIETIRYVKDNKIDFLFIPGDFFESKYIDKDSLAFVISLFQEINETKVFISPGNHDFLTETLYSRKLYPDNVFIFDDFDFFEIDDTRGKVRIYGAAFKSEYQSEPLIPSSLQLDPSYINILVLHGENINNSVYNPIDVNMGFDYYALGHIHKRSLIENGKSLIGYPGIPRARGFDEIGEKGIIEGIIDKGKVSANFIDLNFPQFLEFDVDVSDLSLSQVINMINDKVEGDNKYRVVFKDVNSEEIDFSSMRRFITKANYLEFFDETVPSKEKTENLDGVLKIFFNKVMEEETQYKDEIVNLALKAFEKDRLI